MLRFCVGNLALFALASVCVASARASELEQSRAEISLGAKRLVGIWSCGGSYHGDAVVAKMRWYHLEDGSLWNSLHPIHASAKGAGTIIEQWQWDVGEGPSRWITAPDKTSSDQATFASTGFSGPAMVWIRQAAESTMTRTFTLTGPNRLSFDEHTGGGDGTPKHVIYSLSCKRTLAMEPPPG